MRALPILFFVLACGPSTTVIDGDKPGGDDTDSGADTDTAGDTGDTDTGGDENPDAGDYSGSMRGQMGEDDWAQRCEGDLEFTVAEDGVLEGAADCVFESGNGWDWAAEGAIEGEVVDGDVVAYWSVDLGWGEPYELELTGGIQDGRASLEVYGDFGRMGEFVGEGDAKAR